MNPIGDALSRGEFLQVGAAAGVATATGGDATVAQNRPAVEIRLRWFGGGVYELSTADDKSIVLVDAWIWNNTGWTAFGLQKPPELSSAAAYVQHLKGRNPNGVLVALTHDHGDHIGDYFELLRALNDAGIDVKTVGQSDLMRAGLIPKFKDANLDPAQLVLNGGAGINMGGTATHKDVHVELVPAVHSTLAGFPAAGFIIDIGGTRINASGDTDLFGDMALIGERYQPDLAVLSAGNGAFTMGPKDAAHACKLLKVAHAVPVHYAHNARTLGIKCGEMFRAEVAIASPRTAVTLLQPGETARLMLRSMVIT